MLLGLDIGTKRTGVAISEGEFAHEYTTIVSKDLVAEVRDICLKEAITTIVVGLPLQESHHSPRQADFVQEIGKVIQEATRLPVAYENERLTTTEAERILKQMGVSAHDIEKRIDQFSAQLILQQYIDHQKAV